MGNNQKKLIKLMEYKAIRISNVAGVPKDMYFSDLDKKEIEDLPDNVAEKMVRTLIQRLESWKNISGKVPSDIASLPYCWVYRCRDCPYGKYHGICYEPDIENDYSKLRAILEEKKKQEVVLLNSVCRTQTMLSLLKFGVRA